MTEATDRHHQLRVQQAKDHQNMIVLDTLDGMIHYAKREGLSPQTGIHIAAGVRWTGNETRWTFGVNDERHPPFQHAERAAISLRVDPEQKLSQVMLVGAHPGGPAACIKHALPCEACTTAIHSNATPGAFITVFSPQILHSSLRAGTCIPLDEIVASYQPYDKPACRVNQEPIELFLAGHTQLHQTDIILLSDVCKQIEVLMQEQLQQRFQMYITGSAVGKGGPSGLASRYMLGSPYGDIDIVLITPDAIIPNFDQIVATVYASALQYAGISLPVHTETVKPYLSEEEITAGTILNARFVYSYGDPADGFRGALPSHIDHLMGIKKPASLDVTFGQSLAEVMTPKYLRKNWYARVF